MTAYRAPIDEMEFILQEVLAFERIRELPGCEELSPDMLTSILTEAAKLAETVLAPLNQSGDREGSRLENTSVKTPPGWREAYQQFVASGWNALPFSPEYGGQGLPWLLGATLNEMWHSANMAFALCPMLTQAAVEALTQHGSAILKKQYLPKLISGEWTGTMNLTEPQAGSDLGAIKTKAVPNGDHYLISGQKIFITYGDHDLSDNIIHMVLARTPDAPTGVKGISFFLVPKMRVDENNRVIAVNDIRCVSLEHKLGIHASPTAVLSYGDEGGAIGYLIGEENRGLEYMFTMMNLARHAVGVEGLAISERAYQQAKTYAAQRVQGTPPTHKTHAAIIEHPDIRRMLMTMKAYIDAMRGLAYYWAAEYDHAQRHPDPAQRQQHLAKVELLTPIVKGWCTENSVEITSLALQVHGGTGYIEESGIAQHFRDARITPIYEGTTGIQANDLVGRKTLRDQGAAAKALITAMLEDHARLRQYEAQAFQIIDRKLINAIAALEQSVDFILAGATHTPELPAYTAVHYLKLFGIVSGGWQIANAAMAAQQKLDESADNKNFYTVRIKTALFYAQQILPMAGTLAKIITDGSDNQTALSMQSEDF